MTVTISKERNGTLYAGTPFFLNCDIVVSPLVTIPFTVTNQWTRNDANVPMGPSDDTITDELNMIDRLNYNATLTFYPLDNANHSGVYICCVRISAPFYPYIGIRIEYVEIRIIVQGKVMYLYIHFVLVCIHVILCFYTSTFLWARWFK